MTPLERLTHHVSFRRGILVIAGIVVVALSSTSPRRVGLGLLAVTAVDVAATTPMSAGSNDPRPPQRSVTRYGETDTAIRPFRVNVPDGEIADLRRRLAATRSPDKETVADRSQGAQLANLQPLVRYWGAEYDWRKGEAKLNAFPQFKTRIDGADIHFIHVKSRHSNALPLIVTHGWQCEF